LRLLAAGANVIDFPVNIGDGNLHIGVHLPVAPEAFPESEIDACVYGLVREWGGSVSAEHGIGTHK
jgi:FAD/FMN-containing dehydrogenase